MEVRALGAQRNEVGTRARLTDDQSRRQNKQQRIALPHVQHPHASGPVCGTNIAKQQRHRRRMSCLVPEGVAKRDGDCGESRVGRRVFRRSRPPTQSDPNREREGEHGAYRRRPDRLRRQHLPERLPPIRQ